MSQTELLSPAGDFETALAAFDAGADAVYCGLADFSARAFAKNLSFEDLGHLVRFAHAKGKKVYVTFNTLVDEVDVEQAVETLSRLEEIGPDALIVQDLGIARLCRRHFPGLALHASTQLVAHNLEGVLALKDVGFTRVVLARELSLAEIASISKRCGGLELECFIHGALCYSISGLCLFGAMEKGRSGNRGKCPYCCRMEVTGNGERGTGNGADFPVRPWMLKTINEQNCSPHLRGDWWWEAGLGRDQIAEGEYIRDYGLLVAFSNWAFVKNGYSKKDSFADKELKWVAYNAGRRESRRLLGDFILDQNHLRKKDFQPDGTCATTWTIDLHLPKTARESKFEGEPYQSNSLNEKIWPYPIPYRCLYSRNVPNLFMAGRDISVTHIALGTTRLMRTHGMMGEVVGMAASICKKHGCNPRDVYTTHLDELKELMTKGVGDGKKHPRQDYNVQQSLDPDIKTQYEESVKGLLK